MDQATAFLAALRAAQHLSGAPLPAPRIEALATTLGLQPETLPGLIAALQREKAVALVWGGGVEVLPESPGAASSQVVHVGQGGVAQVAGRDATMGSVNTGAAAAIGQLAAALEQLRAVQPTLSGKAAEAAQAAEGTLTKAADAHTPASERTGLISRAVGEIKGLLAYAPQVKDVSDIIEAASKMFS